MTTFPSSTTSTSMTDSSDTLKTPPLLNTALLENFELGQSLQRLKLTFLWSVMKRYFNYGKFLYPETSRSSSSAIISHLERDNKSSTNVSCIKSIAGDGEISYQVVDSETEKPLIELVFPSKTRKDRLHVKILDCHNDEYFLAGILLLVHQRLFQDLDEQKKNGNLEYLRRLENANQCSYTFDGRTTGKDFVGRVIYIPKLPCWELLAILQHKKPEHRIAGARNLRRFVDSKEFEAVRKLQKVSVARSGPFEVFLEIGPAESVPLLLSASTKSQQLVQTKSGSQDHDQSSLSLEDADRR